MQTDSVELSFLSIFAFITFFIFLIVSKYSHKLNNGVLLDKDFLIKEIKNLPGVGNYTANAYNHHVS